MPLQGWQTCKASGEMWSAVLSWLMPAAADPWFAAGIHGMQNTSIVCMGCEESQAQSTCAPDLVRVNTVHVIYQQHNQLYWVAELPCMRA